ncbi:hypothetical protein AAG570_003275 [Ranatra chinensis]|uniref:Reverse transcriptase domain-containing protein n=1 Tax=Ranatra chinensis TaxID=642074 RepID=A0ABD0Y6E5_9HEMI
MIPKPTWTFGIELGHSARKSKIDRIRSFQYKTLRTILDEPWSVPGEWRAYSCAASPVLDSIVVSIPACHAGDVSSLLDVVQNISDGARLPSPATMAKRKAAASAETSPATPQVPVSNSFELLANAPEIVPDAPKKEFVPPIVLNGKPANITQFITDTRKVTEHDIRVRSNGRNTKIIVASRKDYQKVYDLYKERNVQFFSFAFKDDHLKRFVLHDLPETFTPEVILAELKRAIPSITSVSQMTKKLENGSTRKLPLFVVTAKKDVTIQSFSQVRAIFYHEYKVEKFRSGGSNVVQCYKCQNFGHTNRFCNMPERCVRCGQAHSAKECKETILKCPNCSENHSAGSLNCKVRHLYIQRNVSRNSPKKVERVPAATVPPITINKRAPAKKVTEGLSFSEVLGGTDKSTRPAQVNSPTAPSVGGHSSAMSDFIKDMQIINRELQGLNLLQMTHLKPHTKLYTPGYITVRNDRVGRNGGGVAILLKESIPFRQIDLPTDPDGTETLGIKVILNNRSTTIINVYNPPNVVLKECLLRNLFDYRGTVIVAGDFNARHRLWHCIRKNANGATLYDFVMNRGATLFAPETPTYVPSHGKGSQSTLDLVLANSSRCISSISTLTEGGSDHLPVYFELWGTPQTQLKKPRFDFRRTDWDVFRCALNNVIPTARPPLGTATDIDTAVVTFTEEITAAVQASTPTSTPRPQKLELPEEILDLIRDKNKVRRLWQVHRRVEDKRAYNRLHKEVRSRISQWRSNRWDELLRNVSPQDNSLWKLTRRLNRQGSWTTPTLRTETTTATTDLEKAELLAQHFAAINNNSVNRGNDSFNEKVEAEVRRLITGRTNSQTQDASEVGPNTISSPKHATPREIEKIIKKLKNNKSPGSDGIPNTVLKHFTRKALVKLTNITNAILKHAHYPTHWKTATVIALPKPGKPTTEPSSYRPISLLSSLAKVVDRIILNRLTDVGDKMRIIPDNQFGFRRNHATIHQLSRVVSHISGNMAKRNITAMVLLDSEKAFDTVWIEGLIQRLATYSFPSPLIKLVSSYLTDREIKVRVGNKLSAPLQLAAGLPQGSVMSPWLFNIYTSHLLKLQNSHVHIAGFADDLALYSSSVSAKNAINRVRNATHHMIKELNLWKINVNAAKSEAILFTPSRKQVETHIHIRTNRIPFSSSVKYLGAHIDNKLNWNVHTKTTNKLALSKLGRNYCLFRSSEINSKHKLLLYKAIVRPTLTYGCQVWHTVAETHLQKLQITQNKCIRLASGQPIRTNTLELHKRLNIPTLKDFIEKMTDKFKLSLLDHPNVLTRNTHITSKAKWGPTRRNPGARRSTPGGVCLVRGVPTVVPHRLSSIVYISSLLDVVQNISDGASLPSPATMAKRKAAASAETSPATLQVPVSNSFELLANAPEIVPDAPKKEFVPPIVLNGKPANITQFITDTRKVTEHDIRVRSNGRNTKIIVASRKDYQKVYDLYKERNVQFFSFAFKDDHLKRFVLHDLPETFTPEVILAELKRAIPSINSVSQMTKKLENGSTRKLPLFIVTTKKDVTIQSFSQVRAIFYHEYKVEKFRSGGTNVVQCYKCQNFGHTNRFCNMPERCVRCGQAHSAKECKETILKCPNCSENHSAGSLNCKVRHLYIQRNVSRNSPKKVERVPAATVPPITINKRAPAKKVTEGLSFSEVLGGTDKSTRPAQVNSPTAPSVGGHSSAMSDFIKDMQIINRELQGLNLLQMTHLKPHTKLYTPGYITVRNDRVGRNGGGVAILLKESIPFRQIDLPTDPDGTETLGIKVILNNRSTTIINVYNPPNVVLKECLLRNLFDYRGTVIVAGDFNARHRLWHCIRKNANGATLYDFVMNRGATLFAPETPTYVPSHGKGSQSTLDLVLANSSRCISSISTLTEGGSDHLPVYFELWGTPQTQLKKPRFDFRRTDWDVFRCALNNVIPTAGPPLGTATDIDTAVVTFTEEITAAVQASTPTSTPRPQKLELPEEILDLIRDKNKVRRLWQVHRRVEDKRAYNRLHKEVQSRISQWRSSRWDELLRNVSPQDNSLWKLTRRLNRQGSWTTPTLRTETTTATTDLEKAELLAKHFAAINNNSVNRGNDSFNEKVEAEVRRLITGRTNSQTQDASEVGPNTISSPKHATPREIEKIIKKLKNNKSPGSDGIPNTVLKHFTRKALVKLTNITNAILKHAYYPTHWKTATVIALPKPGKPTTEPSSYRPISLLSSLAKVVDRIILNRLTDVGDKMRIIPDNQFGFRRNHATIHQLSRVVSHISGNMAKRNITAMVLLDSEKAFDTVWIEGLIQRLATYSFPSPLIKLVSSYLTDREIKVRVGNKLSAPLQLAAGLPQGSVMSPWLFNIYTSHLLKLQNSHVHIAGFADDLALYSSSVSAKNAINRVRNATHHMIKELNLWKINVNAAKSEAILFTPSRKQVDTHIHIRTNRIPFSSSVKYLGVHIDNKLNWNVHTKTTNKLALSKLGRNYCLFRSSEINSKHKLLLYKAIVRPTLTYGCQVWHTVAETHLQKLQITQNKCIRLASGQPIRTNTLELHKRLNIPTLKDFIEKMTDKFKLSLLDHPNVLTRNTHITSKAKWGPTRRNPGARRSTVI